MQLSSDTISGYFSMIFDRVPGAVMQLIKNPSTKEVPIWQNEFWVLFIVWGTTFLFEQLLPKKKNYPVIGRKGFLTDLFYLFFIDFLFQVIGFLAITYTLEFIVTNMLANRGIHLPMIHLNKLPLIVQFLVFFVIMDFSQFLAHYLLHRIEFFWKFHKIHHAQETLGFASTRHFHVMEYLVLRPMGWLPMAILGFSAHDYLICTSLYIWIAYFLVFFSHCNVKLKFGFLNYIVITPDTHYWHHAKNIPRKYGVNYASVLTIWDFLFRSFYLPTDPKLQPILGVPDNDVPKSFWGQLIYPFKTLRYKGKESQSSKQL